MTAPKKAQDVSGYARQKARSTLLRTIETIAPEVVKSLKELDPFDWAAKQFGGVEWAHRQAERTLDVWRDFPKSESSTDPSPLSRTPVSLFSLYRTW